MADKKGKACESDKKVKPSTSNDQLGENAGEGRFKKASHKDGKSK